MWGYPVCTLLIETNSNLKKPRFILIMKRGYVFMTQTPLASMQAFRFSLPGTYPSLADKKPKGETRHGKATSRTHALALPPAGSVRGCQAWGTTKEKLSRILWPQGSTFVGRDYLSIHERRNANRVINCEPSISGYSESPRFPPFSHSSLPFGCFSTNTAETPESRSMSPWSRRIKSS